MASDVDQAYYHWSQEEDCDGDEHQETSVSGVVDHESISFGRFASETLSWERRSVFTHDRRQEELDQFNGLVAKKKAYFEERYRRLRALKALRQRQQTELLLDYDGEGSNTSQSEGGDEKISKHRTLEVGIENSAHAPSGKEKTEASIMISCSEALQRNELHLESTFLNFSSSGKSLVNILEDGTNLDPFQSQPLASESSSVRENTEEHEARESSSLGNEDYTGEPEILESSINPKTSTHESMMNIKSSKAIHTQPLKKSQSNKSFLRSKESASGIQSGQTLRRETRSDVVRQSKGIKDASKKIVGRAESSYHLRKNPITRVNNNTRSSMVASNKPLAETQPKSNTPGPFTLVMERRASRRGIEVKMDSRTPSKSAFMHTHANVDSRVENTSRKTAVSTEVKSIRNSDSGRVLNEARKKTLLSDNQTSLKRAQPPLLTSKSRSLNLPARAKFGSTIGTGQPTSVKENNQKKEKEGMKTPGIITRALVSSMTGHTNIAAKASLLQNSELQKGRRQRSTNLSCHVKSRRQEIPKWR